LNIEPTGFFNIKLALCDRLTSAGNRFAGIKEDVAVDLIEMAFQKVSGSGVLDEILASADKLMEMDDQAFVWVENDTQALKPVDVRNVTPSHQAGAKEITVIAKTGSGLINGGGEGELDVDLIKQALPSFGFGKNK
jgi:hypothetical protein